MKFFSSESDKPTPDELEVIEALLKYPSLEKVFDKSAPDNYSKTKQKLKAAITDLERVIRRGTKLDSEKAEKIITAYRTALSFLDELEQIRQQQAK